MVKDANVHKIARGDYRTGGGVPVRGLPSPSLFLVPKPAEGEEEGMKSRAGVRPRLGGTCRLDRTGRFPAGTTLSRSPSAMSLSLPLKASEDMTGPVTRAPSGVPDDFPIHMREGIGALPEGTEVWTRGRSGW